MSNNITFTENKMLLAQITPIRRCNLRCEHCFIKNEHKLVKDIMDFDVFKNSIDIMYSFADTLKDLKEIEIVLMGGEIHLLGEKNLELFLNYNLEKQEEYSRQNNIDISTTVITNLVDISKSKLDLMVDIYQKYKKINKEPFSLVYATSYEPDTNRFISDKKFNEWKENCLYLKSNGCKLAGGTTGTTGTVAMGAEKIYDLLYEELGLIPHYDHFTLFGEGAGKNYLMPSYEELSNFLIDFFSINIEKYKGFDGLFNYTKPFSLENLNSRWYAAYVVDYDGIIAMDSESSADSQFMSKKYKKQQNIIVPKKLTDETKNDILSKLYKAWMKRQIELKRDSLKSPCNNCKHLNYCQGGFIHYKEIYNKEGECAGIKPFLDTLSEKYWNNWYYDIFYCFEFIEC